MEKKNSSKGKGIENSTFEQRMKKNSSNASSVNKKRLPWWVEFLFVQVGLPDKWLVKILKSKKNAYEFYKSEKKIILSAILFIFAIAYFQPVIKYSKAKLTCQNIAKKYILDKKIIDKNKVKMLKVNLCNGGNEIDKF